MTQPRAYSKNLFFVPSWVWRVIKRYNLSIQDFTDYRKMEQYLTNEDLASLFLINDNIETYIGATNFNYFWEYSHLENDKFEDVNSLAQRYKEEFMTRLYSTNVELSPKAFEIFDLSTNLYVVVIYPRHFSASSGANNRYELTRELLKLEYNRNDFTSCANLPYFGTYLHTLIKSS